MYSLYWKVVKWAEYHKDDPPPADDEDIREKRADDINPWDQEFLKVDQGTLFEIILVGRISSHLIEHNRCSHKLIQTKLCWLKY